MEVPSNPRSANKRRPISSSCCRRSWPVILLRPDRAAGELTCLTLRLRATYPPRTPCHGPELSPSAYGAFRRQPFLVRPADVVGPAQLLECPDHPRTGV